jgi:hypothetical protein
MTKLIVSAVVTLSAMAGGAALWYGPPQPATPQPEVRLIARRNAQAAAAKAKPPATQPAPPQDDLRVIAEHNIFLAAQGHGAAAKAPTTAPSNPTFVLKGVSQRGRQFVAFVEQPNGAGVLEVGVDHALGRGRVCGISLRAMDYEVDGKVSRVEVGQAVAPDGAPSPAAPAAPATRPAPAQVARRTVR